MIAALKRLRVSEGEAGLTESMISFGITGKEQGWFQRSVSQSPASGATHCSARSSCRHLMFEVSFQDFSQNIPAFPKGSFPTGSVKYRYAWGGGLADKMTC
jgi:hypothetical protein